MKEISGTAETSLIREGYDRWARVYDHDANPLVSLEEPVVRAAVGEVAGKRVLDLGCGTGRHAIWLASRGAIATAVDFSGGMLKQAAAKPGAERVTFVVLDLHERLPFADESFDLVVSGLVLEHLREFGFFFSEMRRVLRSEGVERHRERSLHDGGRAVVSAMHPAMFLRGSQARFTDPDSGEIVQPGSFRHELGDVVMAALRAGFGIEDIQEVAPQREFAARYPRAEKYVGWPMLVVLQLNS